MKIITVANSIVVKISFFKKEHPFVFWGVFSFLLSWGYALCEQVAFSVPFSPIPLIIQPLPLFFLSLTLGWPAVAAFALYLTQGALGAPFFAFGFGGIARLMGPTGGYLCGMLIAASFLVITKNVFKISRVLLLASIIVANTIMYTFGLIQLSFFLPINNVFIAGLWPCMPGCLLKTGILMIGILPFSRRK